MLAEFSIVPLDKGQEGFSGYVAKTIEIVKKSGLKYQLHSMGTIVEGPTDKVFALIKKCHKNMVQYSNRVSTSIKIDDRKNAKNRLIGKIKSVEIRLKKDTR